jgi:Carboxypeptidase regulatory-like domain/Putative zinc-finger
MSELLQSGHHPDADQLNAFVEHTLPRHEQEQTLAHLAICPDCRSIVSLSLPPVDAVPALHREPVRRSWFLGGSFVWPVAAALAGLVLFFVHVHNVAIHRRIGVAPTQLAVSPPPAPLPNATTPTTPRAQPPLSSEQQTRDRDRRAKAAVGASKTNQAQTEAVIENQSIAAVPLQARNLGGLKGVQTRSPIESANKPTQSSNGAVVANSVTNGPVPPQIQASNAKDFLQQNGSGGRSGNLRDQSPAAVPAAPPPMPFRQGELAGAAPGASSQTVEVTGSAAPVATLSSMSNSLILNKEKSILAQRPLPSGLAVLSVVSAGRQMLAIDTHNALFFSDDNGMHWKTIPSQWQGKAVKVDVASAPSQPGQRSTLDEKSARSASKVTAIGGPILSPSAKSTLAGTVTDTTGAVIADASIVVGNATTPNIRTVKTGRDGRYLVDDLVPGSYQVEAQATGFNAQPLGVTLAPSQQSLANIVLSVGQISQNVNVDAAAITLEAPSLAKKKTSEPSLTGIQPLLLFEITTDTGERWTSSDGQTWKRK